VLPYIGRIATDPQLPRQPYKHIADVEPLYPPSKEHYVLRADRTYIQDLFIPPAIENVDKPLQDFAGVTSRNPSSFRIDGMIAGRRGQ
jgi:hypothetical protein